MASTEQPDRRRRLLPKQIHQLNMALKARYEELSGARITQTEAARRLSEGVAFEVTLSAFQTALSALELTWPRPVTGKTTLPLGDLLEMIVADQQKLFVLAKELRVDMQVSGPLLGWLQDRMAKKRQASTAVPAQPLLPLPV